MNPELIKCIYNRGRQFVEDNYSDEMMFFDEIWKIYEAQIRKWIIKPPRRWRFKFSKPKSPKFLAVTGSHDAETLITPAVIETVSSSFFQVATIREKLTLEYVEGVITACGKKLSDELIMQIKNFFAPLIIRDLKKIGSTPVVENGEDFEFPSLISQGRKEYILYSHEFPEGKKISAEEYSQEKVNFNIKKKEFFIFLNEKNDEFYVYGNPQLVPDSPKELFKILLKSVNCTLEHEFLYETISGIKLSELDSDDDIDSTALVYKWFSVLKKKVDNRLKKSLKTIHTKGYKLCVDKEIKYYLLDFL